MSNKAYAERIFELLNVHAAGFKQLIEFRCEEVPSVRMPPVLLAAAYVSLLESLENELIYTNASHFKKRLPEIRTLPKLAFA